MGESAGSNRTRGLACPACQHTGPHAVTDSRSYADRVRRRRTCGGCGAPFTTHERSVLDADVIVHEVAPEALAILENTVEATVARELNAALRRYRRNTTHIRKAIMARRAKSSASHVEVSRHETPVEHASGGHQNRRSSDAGVSEADATSGVQPTGETAREDTHADRLEKIADMYGEMFDILDGARELAAQAREAAAVFRSAAEPPAA